MSIDELRELEKRLEEAEDLFLESRAYSLESQKIWQTLRALLVDVTAQRLRLETTEAKSTLP